MSPGTEDNATPRPAVNSSTGAAAMTPADLAELISAFDGVTARLQQTHEQLRSEVARLSRELSDANEQLERTRRLAALGEMAAGIAHEVRNPLGSISLFARMLRDDLADRPEPRKLAERIIAATKGLNAVVGDVLTFSREFRLNPEPCDPSELIARSIEACRHDGVPGWERVEIERPVGMPAREGFELDPGLASQALTNVIRNAIEALIEAGCENPKVTIDVRERGAALTSGKRQRLVGIRVRDNGPGLSDEVLSRMFNPFFTTRKAGTGLGLAIVHRIMDAHGGRVVASNNSGRNGASVELLFPANAAEARKRAESSLVRTGHEPIGTSGQSLPLVAVAASPDRRLSGAA